jgi:ubiquinone/menaquinone biosynthesis C-methylase UbiE
MDVQKRTFPDNDFQVVLDKGASDCLFFVGQADVSTALVEILRVLKRGGCFISVSREPFFSIGQQIGHSNLKKIIELPKPFKRKWVN